MFGCKPTARLRPGGGPTRLWRGCLLGFLIGVNTGCYVYPAANQAPGVGTRLLLELNDRGRVALEKNIGPSGDAIEGVLDSSSDSAFVLKVVRVEYLNGKSNKWGGETLVVKKDLVSVLKERQLSRGKTWLAAAGITAAIVAFVATRGLFAGGSGDREPGNPGDPPVQ